MDIGDNINYLTYYLDFSQKVNQGLYLKANIGKTMINIEKKSKCDDVYINGLKKVVYNLDNDINLHQTNAYISWISIYIEDNINNITKKVTEATNEIIDDYKNIPYNNIMIDKELEKIKTSLNEYLNSSELHLELEKLNKNQNYIKNFIFKHTERDIAISKFKSEKENILNLFNDGYINYKNIYNKLNEINNSSKEVIKKIKNDCESALTYADNYMKIPNSEASNTSVKAFLLDKAKLEDNLKIKREIIFDKVNTSIIIFDDDSIIIKNNGKLSIIEDNIELGKEIKKTIKKEIKNELRKNPFTVKLFEKIFDDAQMFEYNYVIPSLGKIITNYISNSDILKINKFNLEESYKNLKDNSLASGKKVSMYAVLEGLDDEMAAIIRSHKIKQYAHSIASNKYKHLYNEESYKQIEEIYNVYEGSDVLQNYIGKKIARFKTPEDFNDALKSFLKEMNNFSPENILNKAENFGARVIHNENNQVILEISDYKQSKALGSPSWCIVRDEYYFDSYTKGCKQYFAYNFNVESTDVSSLVGITLNEKGQTTAAHYKDDEEIEDGNDLLINLENTINDKKHFLETKIKKENHIQQNLF